MKIGFIIGVLWTIGFLLTGILNNKITNGQYANGFCIMLMGVFFIIVIIIFTVDWNNTNCVEKEQ